MANAQEIIGIKKVDKIEIPGYEGAFFPVLGNTGEWIAVRSYTKHGLRLFNIDTKEIREVCATDNFCENLVFSLDDSRLFYTAQLANGSSKEVKVFEYDIEKMTIRVTEEATVSELNWWKRMVMWWEDEESFQADAVRAGYLSYPFVTVVQGELVYAISEIEQQQLNPFDIQYYMFPSLSPDQKWISAYAVGKGCFVYEIESGKTEIIDDLEAPVWMNEHVIIGMQSQDDGQEIRSSSIVAVDITTGFRQVILSQDRFGSYPRYVQGCNKIICHTPMGEVYLIHLDN